jgi:hypothetical protein
MRAFEELKQHSKMEGERPRFTNTKKLNQKQEESATPTDESQGESPAVIMPE